MERRTFLAAATLPFWGAVARGDVPGKPKVTSRVVGTLRPVSLERRAAFDLNPGHKTAVELNRSIPEIDDIEVLNTASNAPSRKTLRLIAWNTERGRHWRNGARLIQETAALRDPDIILLGEMDLGMARSGNAHTTREMAAALGMNYAYGVEFVELTGGEMEERQLYPGANDWGYHGNAILSRYPLRNVRMMRFPGIEKWYAGAYGADEGEKLQKRLGGRMSLLATVTLGGRDVTIVSVHLESSRKDSAIRRQQTAWLLDEVRRYAKDQPVILGGDLNAVPGEPMFDAVRASGFRVEDTNATSGGSTQKMVDGKVALSDHYIDYLLVRGLRAVKDDTSPKVVMAAYPPGPEGAILADHAIVTAKVELPWV
jgi:endonuclease/exonuclease/phosphatase family metal-dependent hydrolase